MLRRGGDGDGDGDGNGGGAMAAAAGRCSARCFGSRALLRACVHSAFERVCVRARARASMCACVRVRASSRCYFVVNAPARQPSRGADQSCGRFFCRAPLPAPRRVPAQALELGLRRRRWPLPRQQGWHKFLSDSQVVCFQDSSLELPWRLPPGHRRRPRCRRRSKSCSTSRLWECRLSRLLRPKQRLVAGLRRRGSIAQQTRPSGTAAAEAAAGPRVASRDIHLQSGVTVDGSFMPMTAKS